MADSITPRDDLLQPTLADQPQGVSLYSTRAGFLTAFFGGSVAITLFYGLNSRKLGRLGRDLAVYLVGLAVLIGFYVWALDVPDGADVGEYIKQQRQIWYIKYGPRFLALVIWGIIYFLHKPQHRAMELFDIEAPSPWKAALICILISTAFHFGLITLIVSAQVLL